MTLPVLVNLNVNLNLHSCDQCNQRRRRCDRKSPACSQCTFREVSCSYNRPLKRCQVLNREPDLIKTIATSPTSTSSSPPSMHTLNSTSSNSSDSKPVDNTLVIIPFDTPSTVQSYRKSKCQSYNNKSTKEPLKTILRWGNPLFDQSPKFNTVAVQKMASTWPYTMSGFIDFLKGGPSARFPPIYIAKPCLAPCLPVSSAWPGTNNKITTPKLTSKSIARPFSSELQSILHRALINYFEVVNPFNPLFIYQFFGKCYRSEKLMTALWLSGLHHMERRSESETLIKNLLTDKLKELVKLSSLSFSLDSLQLILVIMVGMRGLLGIESMVRQCQNLMIRLAHGLGVHIKLPALKDRVSVVSLERRLAYHLAASTDSNRGWGLQLPYLRTVDHCYPEDATYTLTNHYNDLLVKFNIDINNDKYKNQLRGLGWDLGSLYYSSFLFECIPLICQLHQVHSQLLLGQTNVKEIKIWVGHNQRDTMEASRKILSRLYQIQSQYGLSGEADSSTECYTNGSLMFTRVLCYANASLVTMAESDPRLGNRPPSDPILTATTQIVLDWAFQVIAASLQLPSHLPLFEGRVFLTTTALSFIIRHHHLHPNPPHASHIIKSGYRHLQLLCRHTGLSLHVQENLQILDQLLKNLNLQHLIPKINP